MFGGEFVRSRGQPIQVDGESIYMGYERPVCAGTTITIRWLEQVSTPLQGICFDVKGGELVVNGVTARQAWVLNAGMKFKHLEPRRVRCWCNSGREVTFADLVFEVAFAPPG